MAEDFVTLTPQEQKARRRRSVAPGVAARVFEARLGLRVTPQDRVVVVA